MISIEVLGEPAPKGSMRAVLTKDGRAVLVPSGSNANKRALYAWNKAIKTAVREQLGTIGEPLYCDEPLAITLVFRLARPKSHYGTGRNASKLKPSAPKYHFIPPDPDKLMRSTMDALTGELFDDDARFPSTQIDKQWCDPGRQGVVITVERLQTSAQQPLVG